MSGVLRASALMGVLIACVIATAAHADGPTLKALDEVFAANRLEGFAQAEGLFARAYRAGDLDAMMAVVRSTCQPSMSCSYPMLCENMIDAALPMAEQGGQWAVVGELHLLRHQLMVSGSSSLGTEVIFPRCARSLEIALAAYQKAGATPQALTDAIEYTRGTAPTEANERDQERAHRLQQLGTEYTAAFDVIDDAVIAHDDARAVALCQELMGIIEAERDGALQFSVANGLTGYLWLRGSEPIVARMVQLAEAHSEWPQALGLVTAIGQFCFLPWSGRDDVYYQAWHWSAGIAADLPGDYFHWGIWFIRKMREFGRVEESDRLARAWAQWVAQNRPQGSGYAGYLVHAEVPDDIRRLAAVLSLRWSLIEQQWSQNNIDGVANMVDIGPEADRPRWAYEIGMLLMEFAPQYPVPSARAYASAKAARLFERAGRSDLARRADDMAMMFASDDPAALAVTALTRGSWAAEQGDWRGAIAIMEPVFANQPPSATSVDAGILLAAGYLQMGDTRRATAWFQAASAAVDQAQMAPGERVGALLSLATLAADRDWKLGLLDRALQVAAASELPMLRASVAREFARVSLECGDLDAARTALLDLINQAEGQRERLAFDPRLRQQWFADNIGPYRQLMRVAQLQGDAELAPACAERMRGRALLDQLAWKKVDMQVALPPQLAGRMALLRSARQQAYELLARVMGGSAEGDARGAYMPIRGLYMPVRGGLDQGAPVTDADVARLRGMLDQLAAEEAALEGAIREQVPAYGRAASQSIPTGAEIGAAVARHEGLAVLEYTFADQGLAVVALSGGQARVELIECDRDALYEQIGHFREAIWERSPDARKQAAELYRTLIAPVADAVEGAQRLWVVADGAVQLVPFAALIDGEGKFLGERLPIGFAPSLTLALSSRGERPRASRSAVIVAAPETGATQLAALQSDDERGLYVPIRGMYLPVRGEYMPIRGEGEVSSVLTAMAQVPLPEAEAEGEAIAGRFADALLLTDAEATKAALGQVGGDCGVLHIATHGYADPDFPDFSGLLLAAPPGNATPYQVLTAGEVYGWPLSARLVTLSACQTALGRDVEGEGILGLSRAFIYAGAQDVVCSLWPVSDQSTRTLMTAFYDALAAGAPVEEALQAGQNALPHTGDRGDPFFWAGFIAVRGPG